MQNTSPVVYEFLHFLLPLLARITKKALRWTPQGCRDRGRRNNTWKRTVEELGSMKLSWSEAESKAQDRAQWRSIVGGLCSCRSLKAKKKRTPSARYCRILF